MDRHELRFDLCCPACRWETYCGPAEMARWLATLGYLKRNPNPSPDELRELFLAAAHKFACRECGDSGLVARPAREDAADWPDAPRCADCGSLIPPERLAIFPGATLCVGCQQAGESGSSQGALDYCPRCGTPRQVRPSRGRGLTRYVAVCPVCG